MSVEIEKIVQQEITPPFSEGQSTIYVPLQKPHSLLGDFLIFTRNGQKKYDEAWAEAFRQAVGIVEHDLSQKGLLGEHQLLSEARVERGLWADLKGDWALKGFLLFLRGEGKIEGRARTVSSIQFAWKPNETDTIISEIPADKITIRIDPLLQVPAVRFKFSPSEFIRRSGWVLGLEVRSFAHPNEYLLGDRLSEAMLTVSSGEDLKHLPLPPS